MFPNGGVLQFGDPSVSVRFVPGVSLVLLGGGPPSPEYACYWLSAAGDPDVLTEYVSRWADPANAGVPVPGGIPSSLVGLDCPQNDGDQWWSGPVEGQFDPSSGGSSTGIAPVGALGDQLPPGAVGQFWADGSPFAVATRLYGGSASANEVFFGAGPVLTGSGADPGLRNLRTGLALTPSAALAFYVTVGSGSLLPGDVVRFDPSRTTRLSPAGGTSFFPGVQEAVVLG